MASLPHPRLYTEMVHANAVVLGDRATLLAMDPSEHPVPMQQGGVGLILTVLIVSAPPVAAMFFQGTLDNVRAYSQVKGAHAATAQQGSQGAQGAPPARSEVHQSDRGPQGFPGQAPVNVTQAEMRCAARSTA